MKPVRDPNFPKADRTYGKTRDCRGCRYWSEMYAKQVGMGPLESLCLNRDSKFAYLYTKPRDYCAEWKEGSLGAIDDPTMGKFYREG